jgi:DNA-binding response OmpR family regulator
MRILLIEDDDAMRLGLGDLLHATGYTVRVAADGIAGLELAVAEVFDAIVLDVMLPGMDGLTLCRELRSRGNRVPVLMLTARAWVNQRVEGLDAGADDYLVKPFDRAELLARLRALLRRSGADGTGPDILQVGDVTVDFKRGLALRNGVDIGLSVREMRLLEVLAAANGRAVSREEILDRAWPPGAAPTTRTIDNHIVALRHHLEPDPANPRHLLTVHRVGYRLVTSRDFTTP